LRYKIGVIACMLLGLILLLSGIGKLFMGVPDQLEFMSNLSPIYGFTDIEKGVLTYILPWVEILASVLLILQIFPSFVAIILVLPLSMGFATNNIWMLFNKVEYDTCNSCFGVFEKYIGGFTPLQALGIDVILFILVFVVIVIHSEYKMLWGLIK